MSVEVAPDLARDTAGTEAAARALHEAIDEPNLYVKIPATAEGVRAIQTMIAEGRSINVTLIFSLDRYAEVMEAYLAGLEQADGDLSRISSVASFFVSRVDTEVDRRLEEIGTERRPRAARHRPPWPRPRSPTSASCATFQGPRWEALVARGARVQRPLWASTSTKNPAYPDTAYVDQLDRPRHREHDARGHHRGVPRPRHRRPHRRRRPRRRRRPPSTRSAEVGRRPRRRRPRCSRSRAWRPSPRRSTS